MTDTYRALRDSDRGLSLWESLGYAEGALQMVKIPGGRSSDRRLLPRDSLAHLHSGRDSVSSHMVVNVDHAGAFRHGDLVQVLPFQPGDISSASEYRDLPAHGPSSLVLVTDVETHSYVVAKSVTLTLQLDYITMKVFVADVMGTPTRLRELEKIGRQDMDKCLHVGQQILKVPPRLGSLENIIARFRHESGSVRFKAEFNLALRADEELTAVGGRMQSTLPRTMMLPGSYGSASREVSTLVPVSEMLQLRAPEATRQFLEAVKLMTISPDYEYISVRFGTAEEAGHWVRAIGDPASRISLPTAVSQIEAVIASHDMASEITMWSVPTVGDYRRAKRYTSDDIPTSHLMYAVLPGYACTDSRAIGGGRGIEEQEDSVLLKAIYVTASGESGTIFVTVRMHVSSDRREELEHEPLLQRLGEGAGLRAWVDRIVETTASRVPVELRRWSKVAGTTGYSEAEFDADLLEEDDDYLIVDLHADQFVSESGFESGPFAEDPLGFVLKVLPMLPVVIHNDLNFGNVLLSLGPTLQATLIDFGISIDVNGVWSCESSALGQKTEFDSVERPCDLSQPDHCLPPCQLVRRQLPIPLTAAVASGALPGKSGYTLFYDQETPFPQAPPEIWRTEIRFLPNHIPSFDVWAVGILELLMRLRWSESEYSGVATPYMTDAWSLVNNRRDILHWGLLASMQWYTHNVPTGKLLDLVPAERPIPQDAIASLMGSVGYDDGKLAKTFFDVLRHAINMQGAIKHECEAAGRGDQKPGRPHQRISSLGDFERLLTPDFSEGVLNFHDLGITPEA